VRKLLLACGMQLVLVVGVTAAEGAVDAELAAVVEVVRLIVWDGVHVAAYVGRAVCVFVGLAVAGVVRYVPRDGVQVAACVRRAAGACRWSDVRGRCGGRAA